MNRTSIDRTAQAVLRSAKEVQPDRDHIHPEDRQGNNILVGPIVKSVSPLYRARAARR